MRSLAIGKVLKTTTTLKHPAQYQVDVEYILETKCIHDKRIQRIFYFLSNKHFRFVHFFIHHLLNNIHHFSYTYPLIIQPV